MRVEGSSKKIAASQAKLQKSISSLLLQPPICLYTGGVERAKMPRAGTGSINEVAAGGELLRPGDSRTIPLSGSQHISLSYDT